MYMLQYIYDNIHANNIQARKYFFKEATYKFSLTQ